MASRIGCWTTWIVLVLAACSGTETAGPQPPPPDNPPPPSADTKPPTVVIAAPANGEQIAGDLTVRGTATDESGVSEVRVAINNGPFELAQGTTDWSFPVVISTSGSLAISVRAQDTKSNVSTPVSVSVTVLPGWRALPAMTVGDSGDVPIGVALAADDNRLVVFYTYRDVSIPIFRNAGVRELSGASWSASFMGAGIHRFGPVIDIAIEGGATAIVYNSDDLRVGHSWRRADGTGGGFGACCSLLQQHGPSIAFALGVPFYAYESDNKLYVGYDGAYAPATNYPTLGGGLGQTLSFISSPRIAGDPTGWYVVMHEQATNRCLSVQKGSGSGAQKRWDWIGPCFRVADVPSQPRIAVLDGQPAVLWFESATSFFVARWNGTAWILIGTGTVPSGSSVEMVARGSVMYVFTLTPSASSGKLLVEKWDGATWTVIPGTIESSPNSTVLFSADIAIYKGNPVVAFIENETLKVKRFVP